MEGIGWEGEERGYFVLSEFVMWLVTQFMTGHVNIEIKLPALKSGIADLAETYFSRSSISVFFVTCERSIDISIIVEISWDLSHLSKLVSEHATLCYDSICGLLDQSASGMKCEI